MILVSKMIYLLILPNCNCMVFKPKSYKLSCPRLYMDNQLLKYTDSIKYLGFTFSSDQKDDKDLLPQLRLLYTKSNTLLQLFNHCSTDVKIVLLCSYFFVRKILLKNQQKKIQLFT